MGVRGGGCEEADGLFVRDARAAPGKARGREGEVDGGAAGARSGGGEGGERGGDEGGEIEESVGVAEGFENGGCGEAKAKELREKLKERLLASRKVAS